jgi:hypothetical protein
MSRRGGTKRLVCPECGKKGVTWRPHRPDVAVCRYCRWEAVWDSWQDRKKLVALQRANPDVPPRHRGLAPPGPVRKEAAR